MKIQRSFAIWSSSFLALFFLLFYCIGAQAQSKNGNKYACLEPNPAALCNASNTCGSASTPCTVDVKRTANSAEAVASITKPKGNATFCAQVGTTLTWQSTSKNTGFVVDFGPSDPFAQGGTIIGGSDRSVSVVAKKPGCYKYSAGACVSGAIYGMCGTANAEMIVVGGGN
jgi:plastocyanin